MPSHRDAQRSGFTALIPVERALRERLPSTGARTGRSGFFTRITLWLACGCTAYRYGGDNPIPKRAFCEKHRGGFLSGEVRR